MGPPICVYCGNTCITTRGLTQHETACRVRKGTAYRTILRMPEQTGRKAGACVPRNEEMEDTHDEGMEDTHDKGKPAVRPYYPFNNSADYALALYLHEIGCTKGDVDIFFKTELLEPFRIGLQLQEPFCSGLSFKNGEEWLCQLDRIGCREKIERAREGEEQVRGMYHTDIDSSFLSNHAK